MQSRLKDVGSAVATPPSGSEAKRQRAWFDPAAVPRLELAIDTLDAALPPLRNFILPSGGRAAAALHAARAVCRRAERAVVPLARCGDVEAPVAVFLNRLSDYLFAAARAAVRGRARRRGRAHAARRRWRRAGRRWCIRSRARAHETDTAHTHCCWHSPAPDAGARRTLSAAPDSTATASSSNASQSSPSSHTSAVALRPGAGCGATWESTGASTRWPA